jgi:hypothetical protein
MRCRTAAYATRTITRPAALAAAAVTLAGLFSVAGGVAADASVRASAAHGRLQDLLADRDAALPGTGAHPLSIVTLYAAPSAAQWTTVEDSAPEVAGAVVNICDDPATAGNDDGPGCNNTDWTAKNTAWDAAVPALQKAGVTPLIYITTDNGADSIATLETELSQASQWWGITTPMFDQMVGTEGTVNNGKGICADGGKDITCRSYYGQLYSYALAHGAQAVMFNPGTWYGMSPAFMYGPDEILQGFENSASTLASASSLAPSWADSYGQFQFSATVSAAAEGDLASDVSDATGHEHAGFLYEDDEAEPPDYATLPSWFGTLVSDLSKASLSRPTALFEVQASRRSGYCLDNTGGSNSNGNHIQIWLCAHNANQKWQYVPSPDAVSGHYQLQNSGGGCLELPADSKVNGTKVELWSCLGNPSQDWTARALKGGYTEYVNANGLCLDNTGNSKTNGTRVEVWACNGGPAQQWYGPSPAS